MKIELEISERQLNEQIEKAVRKYMEENGLLGFIRRQINLVYSSTGRKELSEQIRHMSQRITLLEKECVKENLSESKKENSKHD